jgi:hypothetical protein
VFGQKRDPLPERAGNLVGAAQANAVGMFQPLLERFPILREVDVKHSDFILTVAGVFIAASRLNSLRLGDGLEEKLMELVAEGLNQWNPDGIGGFEDCKSLFESEFDRLTAAEHDPRFVAADALGIWIAWNVLGRSPQTNEESMLVRATGTMITHTFFDWWDK